MKVLKIKLQDLTTYNFKELQDLKQKLNATITAKNNYMIIKY
jgi:hypothetical protein